MKNALSIGDHHIWDDLFESWIGLCQGTGLKTIVLAVKNCWQIATDVSVETLKNTKLLK